MTVRRTLEPGSWNPDRSGGAGFTLMELLISVTILALIFVTVLGAIRVGSRSWESGERRAEENQRTRTLYDTLARDLTMLYPLRLKEENTDVLAFRGSPDSIEFATLPQGYGAEPFSHMIRIVTYTVEPDRGLVSSDRYPFIAGGDVAGLQDGRAKSLDERVSEVRFRYLVPDGNPEEKRPPIWRDRWEPSQEKAQTGSPQVFLTRGAGQRGLKGSDRLPLAVEITMSIRDLKQEGLRELILPPLLFPVQVGRTL